MRGDGGGIGAAGSVSGHVADKRGGKPGDAPFMNEQVDGFLAGEVSALEENRGAVARGQSPDSFLHGLRIRNLFFSEQRGGFIEIRRDQSGARK